MRYKLSKLVKDELIDQNIIQKIMFTDFTADKDDDYEDDNNDNDENDHNRENEDEEEDEEEDDDDQEEDIPQMEIELETETKSGDINENEIIDKLGALGTDTSNRLSKLVGFIKQDSIDNHDS